MKTDESYLKPYVAGGFYGLFILMLWYFSCIAIEESLLPKSWDYFLRLVISLVATFVGALLAFQYRAHEKNNEVKGLHVENLNNALVSLARQRSLVQGIKKTVDGRKSSICRRMENSLGQIHKLKLTLPLEKVNNVDINSLTFLIKDGLGELIKEIVDSDSCFNELITKIDNINYYYINEILPKLESKKYDIEQLNSEVLNKEDELIIKVESTLNAIEVLLDKLYNEANTLFPNYIFIDFNILKS